MIQPDGTIPVLIDGRQAFRPVDFVDCGAGLHRPASLGVGALSRVVPKVFDNERIEWVLGDDVPRIITVMEPRP